MTHSFTPQSTIKRISTIVAISLMLPHTSTTLMAAPAISSVLEGAAIFAIAPAVGMANHYAITGDTKKAALAQAIASLARLINKGFFIKLRGANQSNDLLDYRDYVASLGWAAYDAKQLVDSLKTFRKLSQESADADIETIDAVVDATTEALPTTANKTSRTEKIMRIGILPLAEAIVSAAMFGLDNPDHTTTAAQSLIRFAQQYMAAEKSSALQKKYAAALVVNFAWLAAETYHLKQKIEHKKIADAIAMQKTKDDAAAHEQAAAAAKAKAKARADALAAQKAHNKQLADEAAAKISAKFTEDREKARLDHEKEIAALQAQLAHYEEKQREIARRAAAVAEEMKSNEPIDDADQEELMNLSDDDELPAQQQEHQAQPIHHHDEIDIDEDQTLEQALTRTQHALAESAQLQEESELENTYKIRTAKSAHQHRHLTMTSEEAETFSARVQDEQEAKAQTAIQGEEYLQHTAWLAQQQAAANHAATLEDVQRRAGEEKSPVK